MIKDKQKKQEIGIGIKQDMLENQVKIVFLAIGSNLGNKEKNICLAKYKLQSKDVRLLKSSSNYETLSWPNKKDPKFINAVIKISTTLSPIMLMQKCLNIENDLGRKRSKKNEPRICDIDIIDYDQKILKSTKNKNLILPHPEMHKRSFVLLPLYEISQSWIHPVKKKKINKLIKLIDIEDLRAINLI